MRILLIQPDFYTSAIGFRLVACPEPLALEMIASTVPDHDVRILDMRLEANLLGVLEEYSPDLVAITALTTEIYAAQEVLRMVKSFSPEIFTLIGGHHVSLMPEDCFLPYVDAIAVGDGEESFPELIKALSTHSGLKGVSNLIWRQRDGTFCRNAMATKQLEMDQLRLPRRDLADKYRKDYFFLFDRPDSSVATSRGCPYHCKFCSVWEFHSGKIRQMCPQNVIEQVKAVTTKHIVFVDDNFLMRHQREDAIADLLKAEGIKKRYSIQARTDSIVAHPELVTKWMDVGLYAVLLGLEGADNQSLANVNKKNSAKNNDEAIKILHDHGVIIWGAFIADPSWEADDFKRLQEYVYRMEITHTQFTVLTPLPGTELYRQVYDQLLTKDYTCFDTLHAVLPTRLPREEFYQHFANLYRQTNVGPYYDLVRAGMLTIDDCRRGKRMLETMSRYEYYLDNDPILRGDRNKLYIPPKDDRATAPQIIA